MRLVMIGCGGFIGSHLLDRLLKDDSVFVEGWDPQTAKIAHHLGAPNLRLHRTTIQDPAAQKELRRAVGEADAVIMLAAICNPSQYNTDPLSVIRANLFDIYPLVELCTELGKWLISLSTSEVYGRTLASYLSANRYDDPRLYELDEYATPLMMGPVTNQRWSYACAKQLLERLIYANHKQRGLPFTIVRPLNFFGPRMDYLPGRDGEGLPRVLACFMSALMDGTPLKLVDGGSQRRTIISIHEGIDALFLMLSKPAKAQNQFFNIGNRDNEVTIAELADLMRRTYAKITGDPRYERHPIEVISSREFYGDGYEDCDRRMPKLDRAREILNSAPSIPLAEVLEETMSFYHQHYAAKEPALVAAH